ncbi:DUF6973 domain-containing protein [Rudanella lutea]|uniref:DUF6973 domain-containing protein n=1 Tax=Rudanella lutea TaxID=451374 RepID=UPI0005C5A65F|nr:hypothetical protein [Rudanella lutea]
MGNEASDSSANDYGDGGSGADPMVIVEEMGTNACEDSYLALHPWIVPLMYLNREQNNNWCRDRYPEAIEQGESSQNAMRHALYQAQNFCTIGESATYEMASRHEICDGELRGSPEATAMDLANNDVGIQVGRELQSLGLCDSFQAIITFVEEAYYTGRLWHVTGSTLSPTP